MVYRMIPISAPAVIVLLPICGAMARGIVGMPVMRLDAHLDILMDGIVPNRDSSVIIISVLPCPIDAMEAMTVEMRLMRVRPFVVSLLFDN